MKKRAAWAALAVALAGCGSGEDETKGEGGARVACEHFVEQEVGDVDFDRPDTAIQTGDRWKIEAAFNGNRRYFCVVKLEGDDWVLQDLTVK